MTHIESTIINLARTHGGIVTVGDMRKAGFPPYALRQWLIVMSRSCSWTKGPTPLMRSTSSTTSRL